MNIPLILGNGGDVWADDGSVALNSDVTRDVWQKVKQLRYEDGASPAALTLENIGMNASQMLQTGKVAMIVEGSWALQELATMGFPVGVASLPKIGDEAVTHGQAHVHAAWNNTEHPEEAWELIKFLSSAEYQSDLIHEQNEGAQKPYLIAKLYTTVARNFKNDVLGARELDSSLTAIATGGVFSSNYILNSVKNLSGVNVKR